jgi:antiviral helicase SLH1
METEGEGYICTTDDKLDHYLQAVTSQVRAVRTRSSAIADSLHRILLNRSTFMRCSTWAFSLSYTRFTAGIIDSLNAEIALGTVANVRDGVQWLGYTYMFVRMRKNPLIYGRFVRSHAYLG